MVERVKLPTAAEVWLLPRWARVAFAARCARRALPLFQYHWQTVDQDCIEALTKVVAHAEHSAATADDAGDRYDIWLAANTVYEAAQAAVYGSGYADWRAIEVADTVRCADATLHPDPAYRHNTHYAVLAAARAGCERAAIASDFETLLGWAAFHNLDDTKSVPPEVFDSLWSSGVALGLSPDQPGSDSDPQPEPFLVDGIHTGAAEAVKAALLSVVRAANITLSQKPKPHWSA